MSLDNDLKLAIVRTIVASCPITQAIHLFGSFATEVDWPDSDADIAMLLPPDEAKLATWLSLSPLRSSLESLLHRSSKSYDQGAEIGPAKGVKGELSNPRTGWHHRYRTRRGAGKHGQL